MGTEQEVVDAGVPAEVQAAEEAAASDAAVSAAYDGDIDATPVSEAAAEPVVTDAAAAAAPVVEKVEDAAPAAAPEPPAWDAYWKTIKDVHPTADADTSKPEFAQFWQTLTEDEQKASQDPKNPIAAVKVLSRFYRELDKSAKETPAPSPQAISGVPEALEASGFKLSGKFKTFDGNETNLKEWLKEPTNQELAAAMIALIEERIPTYIDKSASSMASKQDVDQLAQVIQSRFSETDLQEKVGSVADIRTVSKDPKFAEFLGSNKLESAAWSSGNLDLKAEVIQRFQTRQATATVAAAKETQAAVKSKKDALAKGSMAGQFRRDPTAPGAADSAQAEEAAWNDDKVKLD